MERETWWVAELAKEARVTTWLEGIHDIFDVNEMNFMIRLENEGTTNVHKATTSNNGLRHG